MKEIECWQVDLWDGGDRTNFGFFVDLGVDKKVIEAKYQGCHVFKKTIIIYDTLIEREENTPRAIRRRIWDKLNVQERAELGMKEKP